MNAAALIVAGLALLGSAIASEPPDAAASNTKRCEPGQPMPAIPSNAAPNSTYLSSALPPLRFRGAAAARVEFVSPVEADRICAGQKSGKPVCGQVFYACVRGDRMIMPDPCLSTGEKYAALLCHEVAHRRGWPETHGD